MGLIKRYGHLSADLPAGTLGNVEALGKRLVRVTLESFRDVGHYGDCGAAELVPQASVPVEGWISGESVNQVGKQASLLVNVEVWDSWTLRLFDFP